MHEVQVQLQIFVVYFALSGVLSFRTPPDVLWNRIITENYQNAPYNSFCNRTEPLLTLSSLQRNLEKGEPCVMRCSCDPTTCGIKMVCCPDIDRTKLYEQPHTTCQFPALYTDNIHISIHPRTRQLSLLRMVDGCAHEYLGSDLQHNCLRYLNTTELDYLIPVISSHTGVIYANHFCAECNNVEKFEPFKAMFVCSYLLLLPNNWKLFAGSETIDLIKAGLCLYIFKAPDEEQVKDNICAVPTYTSCNQSGIMKSVDSFLVDACEAYELPVYYGEYRNMHCRDCNVLYNLIAVCPPVTRNLMKSSFYTIIDLDLYSIFESIKRGDDNMDEEQHCGNSSGFYFDPSTVSTINRPRSDYSRSELLRKCITNQNQKAAGSVLLSFHED